MELFLSRYFYFGIMFIFNNFLINLEEMCHNFYTLKLLVIFLRIVFEKNILIFAQERVKNRQENTNEPEDLQALDQHTSEPEASNDL